MNELPVIGSLFYAHGILGSPGGKHCQSLEENVWRKVVSTSKSTILDRDQRFVATALSEMDLGNVDTWKVNKSSDDVQLRRSQVTHRSPQTNSTSTTDSSSESENRVVTLGKCEINNEELLSSDGFSELCRSSYFRPGPKIPFNFNRSTSIPTMPQSTSDLIAIGTIPITSTDTS